jgi:hypothetical protein
VTTAAIPRRRSLRTLYSYTVNRVSERLGRFMPVVGKAARSHAVPLARHVREHAYSFLGMGFVDAAAFTHSLFTGLLVTGLMWFLFEWKVS